MNLQCAPTVENQISRICCAIMSSGLHDQCHDDCSCGMWLGVDKDHMNQFIHLSRLENMIGIWFDLMGFRRPMMKGRNAGILKSMACSSQSSFSHQRPFYCKDKGNPFIKWSDECIRFSRRFTDSSLDGQIESKESAFLIATGRVERNCWLVSITEKQMTQVDR